MATAILTSKNGRRQCAKAKIFSAFIFSNTLFLIGILAHIILFAIIYGIEGFNTSIQIGGYFRESLLELNYLSFSIYCTLMSLLGVNIVIAITVLISSFCKTNFSSITIILILFFLPNQANFSVEVIQNSVSRNILGLCPINMMNATYISGCNTISLLNTEIYFGVFSFIISIIAIASFKIVTCKYFSSKKNP